MLLFLKGKGGAGGGGGRGSPTSGTHRMEVDKMVADAGADAEAEILGAVVGIRRWLMRMRTQRQSCWRL